MVRSLQVFRHKVLTLGMDTYTSNAITTTAWVKRVPHKHHSFLVVGLYMMRFCRHCQSCMDDAKRSETRYLLDWTGIFHIWSSRKDRKSLTVNRDMWIRLLKAYSYWHKLSYWMGPELWLVEREPLANPGGPLAQKPYFWVALRGHGHCLEWHVAIFQAKGNLLILCDTIHKCTRLSTGRQKTVK